MKKALAVIFLTVILVGGVALYNSNMYSKGSDLQRNPGIITTAAKAEKATVREESALQAAKRIDDEIWTAIRNGNTEKAVSILTTMGSDEQSQRTWVERQRDAAISMNKRNVYIIAEAGDTCVAEAVHYLVTHSNKGNTTDYSDSTYMLSLRKTDGKWEVSELSDQEYELINEDFFGDLKREYFEACEAGRNAIRFGNLMWTQVNCVYEDAYTANMAYMYQEKNGNVTMVVSLSNGENAIKRVKKIEVTVKDNKLGQVIKVSEKCDISVLPGTVKLYEITVPARKVKKGTWTEMSANVHTVY